MQTLAYCIGHLVSGDLALLGDKLVQRIQAVELSAAEGGWALSRHLEFVPELQDGPALPSMIFQATRMVARDVRDRKLISGRGRRHAAREQSPVPR